MHKELVQITQISADISAIQFSTTQQQQEQNFKQQKQLFLIEKMHDYAIGIQALIVGIQAKHENFANIELMNELLSYINQINENTTNYALPNLNTGQSIFSTNPVSHAIENDMVVLTFKIPLADAAEFFRICFRIIISHKNDSWVEPGKLVSLYENFEEKSLDDCTSRIINNSGSLTTACAENQWQEEINNHYVEINENQVFIMTTTITTLSISCNKDSAARDTVCPPFSLILFAGCELVKMENNYKSSS